MAVDRKIVLETKTGFLDLPPEIRNRIYRLSLKNENEIRIDRHFRKRNERERGLAVALPNNTKRKIDVKGSTLVLIGAKKRIRVAVAKANPLTILRVCKIVSAEASPMFYGANTFVFQTVTALSEFKTKTAKRFTLLRKVQVKSVGYATREHLPGSLFALKAPVAVKLQVDYSSPDIFQVCKFIWPAIRRFMKNCSSSTTNASGEAISNDEFFMNLNEKRMERFNTLSFDMLGDSIQVPTTHDRFERREYINAAIRTELHRLWTQHVEKEKLRFDAIKMSQQSSSSKWSAHSSLVQRDGK